MKVLVTGGAGFIGSNVADELLEKGYDVIIVDDLSNGKKENLPKEAKFYKCDIRDKKLYSIFKEEKPDIVLLDLKMPGRDGKDFIHEIAETDPAVVIVVITGHATVESAVEAMKLGALDYLTKPLDFHELRPLVDRALEIRGFMLEPIAVSQTTAATPLEGDVLIGRCRAMQAVYKAIGRVASRNVSVLSLQAPCW